MECVQEASAHRGSFDSVQGGGTGIGPADRAKLDNATDGLLHHPAGHLAYGCLPAVVSPLETNHSKGRERKAQVPNNENDFAGDRCFFKEQRCVAAMQ